MNYKHTSLDSENQPGPCMVFESPPWPQDGPMAQWPHDLGWDDRGPSGAIGGHRRPWMAQACYKYLKIRCFK